jgi:hypothetical protein
MPAAPVVLSAPSYEASGDWLSGPRACALLCYAIIDLRAVHAQLSIVIEDQPVKGEDTAHADRTQTQPLCTVQSLGLTLI